VKLIRRLAKIPQFHPASPQVKVSIEVVRVRADGALEVCSGLRKVPLREIG
jgi:hypothetical protein